MGYKVAVATSDGIHIDLHFGQTEEFTIYQVLEDGSYEQMESRQVVIAQECSKQSASGCGGCGNKKSKNERVSLIEDCRCVLCARCGIGTETELGKRNISSFVIEQRIDEALPKIIRYYGGKTERG